jgi:hypothetical protein
MLANVNLPNVPQTADAGKEEEAPTYSSQLTICDSEEPSENKTTGDSGTPNSLETLLFSIKRSSGKEIVDILRKESSCSSDIYPIPSNQGDDLPLSTACALNFSAEVISVLMEKNPKCLKEEDRDGWLPIHWAARCADVHVMKALFKKIKYEPNTKTKSQQKTDPPSLLQIAVDYNLDDRLIEFLIQVDPASAYSSFSVVCRCLKIPSFFESKRSDCENLPDACKDEHCEKLLVACKDGHPLHACLLLSAGFMQCAKNERSQNSEQAEANIKMAEKIEQLAIVIAQYCADSERPKDEELKYWEKMDQLFTLASELKLTQFVSQRMFTSRIWRLWYEPKNMKGEYSDYATIGKNLSAHSPSNRMLIASILETFPGFSMFLIKKKRRYIVLHIILLIFLLVLWLYPLILTSPPYSDSFQIVATASACALLLILPIEDTQIPACMRFTEHCVSYMVFLISASTLPVQIGPGDLQPREIILGYWLLDICFSELIQWHDICRKYSYSKKKGQSTYEAVIHRYFFGSWKYLSDPWNAYDFVSLYTAISAGLARVVVYAGYESSFFTARESNTLYAFAIALLWGRLVKILTIFTLTGPLLIMIFTMIVKDLMRFCFLVVLLELPFVSALSYLESVDGGNTDFATFSAASLSFFKVLIDSGAPEISTVSTYSAVLYSIGTLLLAVLLLNLLITLFGQTFDVISKKAMSEYLLQMMSLTHEWMRAPILPPPCTFALQIPSWSKNIKKNLNRLLHCNSVSDSAVGSETGNDVPDFDGEHFKSIAGSLPENEGEWRRNMLQKLKKRL